MGGPPDVVVETSGVPSAIQMALDLVKMKGCIVSIGLSGSKETPIKFDALVFKGVTIVCDHAQAGNYPDAMRIHYLELNGLVAWGSGVARPLMGAPSRKSKGWCAR